MTGILIFVFLVVMYMLPTIIAARRKHINLGAIACMNIFLGLTILGWFGALIWSLTSSTHAVKGE